jgi:hypothetical protein
MIYLFRRVMTMNMSRFVKMVIGHEAKWGPIPQTTCTLVSDSGVGFPHPVLMMAAILEVVHTKGLRVFGGDNHWRDGGP